MLPLRVALSSASGFCSRNFVAISRFTRFAVSSPTPGAHMRTSSSRSGSSVVSGNTTSVWAAYIVSVWFFTLSASVCASWCASRLTRGFISRHSTFFSSSTRTLRAPCA